MTHWVIEANAEDHRVARLAALAIALAVLDAGIPSPIPGVKPGLANIVTLIVVDRYGWRLAVWVSLLRIFGASLLLGSFLTPGFWLSLGGGCASLLMLALAHTLPKRWFGWVTWSILAAFAHMLGQLAVIYWGFLPSRGVFALLPILAAAALVFGLVNGLIAARLAREEGESCPVSV